MFSNANLLSRNQLNPGGGMFSQAEDNQPISPHTKNHLNQIPSLNTISSMKLNSKISHLIQPEDQIGPKSKVITMLSSSENSFHFHDEAANVLNRYYHNEVVFIGIWGADTSQKAYFYDKILKLCGMQDQKYTESMITSTDDCNIVFYQRPFVKGNMRIFLLDCRGYTHNKKLKRKEKVQLDMLMSICEIIILVETQKNIQQEQSLDIIDIGHQHFNQSFKRLYLNKAQKDGQYLSVSQLCWPKSLFVLYTDSESIKKHQEGTQKQQDLRKMFNDFNFSILHSFSSNQKRNIETYTTITSPLDQLYLKNSQSIFLSVYKKLSPKYFNDLSCTGFTLPHIISQVTTSLNNHNSVFLPTIFMKARKQIYSQMYNRNALNYVIKLKQYLKEEKAYDTGYLLKLFSFVSNEVMEEWDWSYNRVIRGSKPDQMYLQYETKLEDYITEKEQNIIRVNYKKNLEKLSELKVHKSLHNNQGAEAYERFTNYRKQVEKLSNHYDGNAKTYVAGNSLKYIFSKKDPIQHQNDRMQYLKSDQKYQNIKKQVQIKKGQLQKVKLSNVAMFKSMTEQQQSQIALFKKSKMEIDVQYRKYEQEVQVLRRQKEHKLNEQKQQLRDSQQIYEIELRKKQDLIDQLKSSNLVRNRVIQDQQKQIIQKSQLKSAQLLDKQNQIQQMNKAIFQSKLKFYKTYKIAEKRTVAGNRTVKKSNRSKLI